MRYLCETEPVKCADCGEIISQQGRCGCPDIEDDGPGFDEEGDLKESPDGVPFILLIDD